MSSIVLSSVALSALLFASASAQSGRAIPTTDTGACFWTNALCGSYPCSNNKALPVIECFYSHQTTGRCAAGCETKQLAKPLGVVDSLCAVEGYGGKPVDASIVDDLITHCKDVDITDFDVTEEGDCFAAVLELFRTLGCDTDECQDALYANQLRTNKCLDVGDQATCERTVAPCDDLHTYPETPEELEGGVGSESGGRDDVRSEDEDVDVVMPPEDTRGRDDRMGRYGY